MSEGPWVIPSSWRWVTIGEVANVVGGGTPRTDNPANYEGGDIPWITPADLSGYSEKFISRGARNITERGLSSSGARMLPKGAVLFSSRAPIGYVAIAANAVSTNQGFKSFGLSDGVVSSFAYWYLKRAKKLALALAGGTTFLEISGKNAGLLPLPIPPTSEQQRIVSEIEALVTDLDAALAALKRVQANLKRYRASVLKAACEGRLVPTEAELARKEGRIYETGEQLLAHILKERRARWEAGQLAKMLAASRPPSNDDWKKKYKEPVMPDPSKLPELPTGWMWAKVEAISTKVVDGVHKKPDYRPSGVPFVTVRNLTAGPGIDLTNLHYVSQEDHLEFVKRANPEPGDLLVSKDGTLGVVRAVRTSTPFSIFVSVAMIKPVMKECSNYLEIALCSPQVQAQMVPKGSGLQHIHLEDLREDCVPLPPTSEQERIVEEVTARISRTEYLERDIEVSLRRADRLRQAILKRAFEGKLVPQDPNDEPAGVLLERIRADRAAKTAPEKNYNLKRKAGVVAVSGLSE